MQEEKFVGEMEVPKNNRRHTRSIVSDESVINRILQDHFSGISGHKIAKELSISSWTVYNILSNRHLGSKYIASCYVDYVLDEFVFSTIDAHEKAYWLGFLAADGNITERCLRLRLSKKDLSHLEKFSNFLKSNHPIRHYLVDGHECCELAISSKQIVNDLVGCGFTQNKTYNFSIPEIDPRFLSSYILGVFDGDGSFAKNGKGGIRFSLSGCKSHLTQIQAVLMENCNLKRTKLYQNGGCYCLEYQGRYQLDRICKFLYQDNNVYLERKRHIIKEIYGS